MNDLQKDRNLQEAVNRREQKLPPLPTELNERLMQRLGEPETAPKAKARSLWFYAAITAAASIALLIILNFGKEQAPQESLVAQQIEKQNPQQPTPADSEQVEGEPVAEPVEGVEEPAPVTAEAQPAKKPIKKQRKVVMQLVELIPTSESASNNMKTLPASVIDKVKAYDQASDLSRTTGIDDGTDAIVTSTMDIDDPDPLVAMAAQVENIRQRGMRLHEEIRQQMKN